MTETVLHVQVILPGCIEAGFQASQKMGSGQFKVKVLVTQSCPTLCTGYRSTDYCLPGSCVHGILQARILEWVAIPFSRGSSWPRDQTWVSCIKLESPALQADSLPPIRCRQKEHATASPALRISCGNSTTSFGLWFSTLSCSSLFPPLGNDFCGF